MTRLQRTASLAGKTIRPTLFARRNLTILPGRDLRGNPKAKAAEKHLELIDQLPNNAILAYSDGSQTDSGTGWGAASFHRMRATKARGRLEHAEVYDAEAQGALEAMKLVQLRIRENPEIGDAYFFLDNSAVVDGLLGTPPASSQHAYIKFGKLAEALLPRKTIVAWVPGHKDVPGNEVADRLAKEGSELPSYNQGYSSLTNVGRWAKLRKKTSVRGLVALQL
jgi:ribonuclease HI